MRDELIDKAIKFGAGRYRQGKGVLTEAGEELRKLADKVYIVAGARAFEAVKEKLLKSLDENAVAYAVEIYEGVCSYEAAEEYAKRCRDAGCKEVVGIGGGRIMDFAKAVGEKAELGTYNIPTSIATCAAFTNMSIMYTNDGAYLEGWHFDHEVDGILLDTEVIADCPVRYMASGIIDAMAKWIEIPNGKARLKPLDTGFDRYTAYCMAEHTYKLLKELGPKAMEDAAAGMVSKELEYVCFLSVAVTGNISNITRSRAQSALAHAFYYGLRSLFGEECREMLHGEIVGAGLLIQLAYNGMNAEIQNLTGFMRILGLPLYLKELGVEESRENLVKIEEYMRNTPYTEKTDLGMLRLNRAMSYIRKGCFL